MCEVSVSLAARLAAAHAEGLMRSLLSVHALVNMAVASDFHGDHHLRAAADWLPGLERQLAALRTQLTKEHTS